MKTKILLIAVMSLFIATQAFAAETAMMKKGSSSEGAAMFNAKRTSDFIGKTVLNKEGIQLGSVADLVFNADGQVSYIILSRGGLFGIGARMTPIPVNMTEMSLKGNALVCDISKKRLDMAPHFTKGEWPQFSASDWRETVHGYYGKETVPEASGSKPESNMSPSMTDYELLYSF